MEDYNREKKIGTLISTIIREYVIGTSSYLFALFILSINNSKNYINIIFWFIMINLIFENFVLKNHTKDMNFNKKTKIISYSIRVLFIAINILAFGIDIFNII